MTATFEPKITAFVCNWCTYAGADLTGTSRIKYQSREHAAQRQEAAPVPEGKVLPIQGLHLMEKSSVAATPPVRTARKRSTKGNVA